MTIFNAEQFMQQTVAGAMSSTYTPVPEGQYRAIIDEVRPRQVKDSTILDITWMIDGAEPTLSGESLSNVTGLPRNTVRQSIFLDLTPEGFLDSAKNKNVQLGQLREALGQNDPNRPWGPTMLRGGVALVTVRHRIADDGSGKIYVDVKGVQALK